MYKPTPQTIFKRLLANPKLSQRARLTALERLPSVPVSLPSAAPEGPGDPTAASPGTGGQIRR